MLAPLCRFSPWHSYALASDPLSLWCSFTGRTWTRQQLRCRQRVIAGSSTPSMPRCSVFKKHALESTTTFAAERVRAAKLHCVITFMRMNSQTVCLLAIAQNTHGHRYSLIVNHLAHYIGCARGCTRCQTTTDRTRAQHNTVQLNSNSGLGTSLQQSCSACSGATRAAAHTRAAAGAASTDLLVSAGCRHEMLKSCVEGADPVDPQPLPGRAQERP